MNGVTPKCGKSTLMYRQYVPQWTYCCCTKARFPLPELTGDQFPLPVNMGHVDGRAFPLAELKGRQHGPSTRLVETRVRQHGPC